MENTFLFLSFNRTVVQFSPRVNSFLVKDTYETNGFGIAKKLSVSHLSKYMNSFPVVNIRCL